MNLCFLRKFNAYNYRWTLFGKNYKCSYYVITHPFYICVSFILEAFIELVYEKTWSFDNKEIINPDL